MLQCVAVWCIVLQCVVVICIVLQCVAVCCSVLQRGAFSVLQCVAVCRASRSIVTIRLLLALYKHVYNLAHWRILHCVAERCNVLHRIAVCCSVLRCVAVERSVLQWAVPRAPL